MLTTGMLLLILSIQLHCSREALHVMTVPHENALYCRYGYKIRIYCFQSSF